MSRTIHKPWLKDYVQDILNNNVNENSVTTNAMNNIIQIPRIVQVMNCHEDTKSMMISDTEYYIHIFFNKECFEQLLNLYTVESLKYSQVKLSQYFLSTVVQSTGFALHKLSMNKITLPLAIVCSKITYLGANDCEIINNPTSLNQSKEIQSILERYEYQSLVDTLGFKQFPIQRKLPNWDLSLEANLCYLSEEKLVEPEDQLRIIHSLNSFNYVHILHSLPALRSEVYKQQAATTSIIQPPLSLTKVVTQVSVVVANNPGYNNNSSSRHLEGDSFMDTVREEDPYDSDTQISDNVPYVSSHSANESKYTSQHYDETQVDGTEIEMPDWDFPSSPTCYSDDIQVLYHQFTLMETQHTMEASQHTLIEIQHTLMDMSQHSESISLHVEHTLGNDNDDNLAAATEDGRSQAWDTLHDKLVHLQAENRIALPNMVPFHNTETEIATSESDENQSAAVLPVEALNDLLFIPLSPLDSPAVPIPIIPPVSLLVERPPAFLHNDPSELYHTQKYITQEERGDLQDWYASSQADLHMSQPFPLDSPTICVVDPQQDEQQVQHQQKQQQDQQNQEEQQEDQQEYELDGSNHLNSLNHNSNTTASHSIPTSQIVLINDGISTENAIKHVKTLRNGKNVLFSMVDGSPDDLITSPKKENPMIYLRRRMKKKFGGVYHEGTVVKYREPYYNIKYDDGDSEDLNFRSLNKYLLPLPNELEDMEEELTQPQIVSTARVFHNQLHTKTGTATRSSTVINTTHNSSVAENSTSSNTKTTVVAAYKGRNNAVVGQNKKVRMNSTTAMLYAQESSNIIEDETEECSSNPPIRNQYYPNHQRTTNMMNETPSRTYKRNVSELLNSNEYHFNHYPSMKTYTNNATNNTSTNNNANNNKRLQLSISRPLPIPDHIIQSFMSSSSTSSNNNSTNTNSSNKRKRLPDNPYALLTSEQISTICNNDKSQIKKLTLLSKLQNYLANRNK